MPESQRKLIHKNNIHLFEEHSSTLPIWWERHDSPRTAVYLDAHLDLQKTADDAIAALKICTRLDEVKALEAPDHLNPSTRYAFGIENFLYAAHQLKLIDRLIWVSPPHIPRNYSNALISYMQQMDGISFEELMGFQKVGGNTLRGSLMGLDITICDYDELASLGIDDSYYLDIDIDYFVEVPADRLWIDPAIVVNSILQQLGDPSLVTISKAVSSGFTPVAYGFVGDYIQSLITGRNPETDYYRNLTLAIHSMDDGKLAQGKQICEQLIKDLPNLAPAYYVLALGTADSNEKSRLLDKACARDSAYRFNLARDSIGLLHRKKPLHASTLQQLTAALERLEPGQLDRQQALVALAQVLSTCGKVEQAQTLLARQSGEYAQHEDVLLAITARQLTDPGKLEQNKAMLNRIANGEKNATTARLYLGDLEFAEGDYQLALEHYCAALGRAPAWMQLLERIHASYQKLGMNDKAGEVEQQIIKRKRRLEKILAQA